MAGSKVIVGFLLLFILTVGSLVSAQTAEEAKYDHLRDDYNEYYDDYRDYKREFIEARLDRDDNKFNRYKDRLEKLYEKTKELEDDIDDFLEDLEDDGPANVHRQTLDLEDDAQALRGEVQELLDFNQPRRVWEEEEESLPLPEKEEPKVIVIPLDFTPRSKTTAIEQKEGIINPVIWIMASIAAIIVLILILIIVFIEKVRRK